MNCEFCGKKLRVDNNIGTCRKHRPLSASRKLYMKKYAKQNFEIIKAYKAKWSNANKTSNALLRRERYKTDINFKLGAQIRTRINKAIKANKPNSAIKALGCTISELKNYLESKFLQGMTWENNTLDGWHIDHIVPLCNFDLTDDAQFKAACHYTNLQPLWSSDNLRKPKRIKNSHECPTTY